MSYESSKGHMESSLQTVNSPRATPCLLRRKNKDKEDSDLKKLSSSHVSVSDGRRVAGGAKQSEVYGFVGAISTVITTVVFLMWAYTPESWLHWLGITYYPSKYWALAIPVYVIVSVFSVIGFYIALNFMISVSPTSLNTIFDDYTREPSHHEAHDVNYDRPIDPISDIRIDHINDLMFGRQIEQPRENRQQNAS